MPVMRFPAVTTIAICIAVAGVPAQTFADTFAVMSYNVRGLPPLVIENRSEEIAAIAPLLEDFHTAAAPYLGIDSVVGLQELFFQPYYDVLTDAETVSYPYATDKDTGGPVELGDGLTLLSDFGIDDVVRVQWDLCFGTLGYFGSDCDTSKGFSYSRVLLEQGLPIDVYTLHADAGQDFGSRAARRDNVAQLASYINGHSPAGTAVIVLGDTNSFYTRLGNDNIQSLLADAGLTDVWVELRRDGIVPGNGDRIDDDCETAPGSGDCELFDKILYRSGDLLRFEPTSYEVLNEMFSDEGTGDLSDHFPVVVVFEYTRTPSCGDANDDGKITAADALKVLRVAVGIGICAAGVCDYTGDGEIAASDALAILRVAVGQDLTPLCAGSAFIEPTEFSMSDSPDR
jgi:hypothetical protein